MTTLFKKGLVFAVIVLFVGASVVPSISSDVESSINVIKDKVGNIGSCSFGASTFYPTDDAYVSSTIPSQNTGDCTYLAIRNGGSGNNWAAQPVIKFDISSETDIKSATLNIFYRDYADNNPSGRELTLYRLKGDWNEESITWDNMPVHHNEITSSVYAPNSPGNWMQWNVTSDVQDFITGQTENYGWIIKDEQYWGGSDIPLMYCNSKEYGENIPYLEIETLEQNLVACWHFDEGSGSTAYDSSGNNNDGTIYGASWTAGVNGTALDYDGNDGVHINDDSSLDGFSKLTILAWAKPHNHEGGNMGYVVGKYEEHYAVRCPYRIWAYEGDWIVELGDGSDYYIARSPIIMDEQWYHLVLWWDGTELKLFVNGNETDSAPANTFLYNNNEYLRFGERVDDGFFDGIIDEVSIYNYALTADEILALYQQYAPAPTTVYVDDDYTSSTPGWQYDHFDVIQDGINAVAENGTVYVCNGTYYENVVVDKTIDLIGEDRNETIIDGGGVGDVVYVTADTVTVNGFTIQNSGIGSEHAGICIINNNILISNNIISNNEDGIRLIDSEYTEISSNILNNNQDDDIVIRDYSNNSIVTGNKIISHNEAGIILYISNSDNIIFNNTITNHDYGIIICYSSNFNTVYNNVITKNNLGIYIHDSSDTNKIYHNNLMENTQNAYDGCINTWDNGYPSGGNYFDDYTAVDNYHGPNQDIPGSDGIGDTPYLISGGSSQDNYPFMNPSGWLNSPPTANFTYSPSSPTDLDVIQFTDTSYDLDGYIVNWTWDFDDGNISYLQNPTHRYCDDGTYHTTLTVKDDDDATDSISKDIIVDNVPPAADANGPYAGYVNQLIQFDGSGSYDLDGAIVSYDWNFGDGHTGTGVKPTHKYTSTGTYIVALMVEDDDGDTDTNYTFSSIGLQISPQADANGPYEGHVGGTVQFHGSATGGEPPYTWHWDFGNGYSSSLQNPIYTYGETGVYTVVLTVTDDNGNSDDDTTTATIYPENVLLADAGGPSSGFVNESVQFYGNASGGEPPYSWYWDFGDGNTSALQNPTHIYDKVGEYDVILTVTDDFGQTDNDMASVTIKSHPPNKPSKPSGPTSGKAGEEYTYSTSTTDHDGDQVYYKWYWGDKINETSGWDGPYDSGDTVTASHIWDEKGDYIIKVKAKDVHGEESPWSDPLPITMPKNKAINPFLLFLERFMERFPILEQILQPIYDKLMSLH